MSNIIGILFMQKLNAKQIYSVDKILDYFCGKKQFRLKDFDKEFTDEQLDNLFYENIISYKNIDLSTKKTNYLYYRLVSYDKSQKKLKLKEICDVANDTIHYSSLDISSNLPVREFDLNVDRDGKKLCILSTPINTLKPDSSHYIYHGTGYRMPEESDRSPYNKFGNWYIYTTKDNPQETESYTYITKDIGFLYTYKLKNELKYYDATVIDGTPEYDNYVFLFIMHFDIKIGYYDDSSDNLKYLLNDPNKTLMNKRALLYYDTHTMRTATGQIEKYNYTQYENLLKPDNKKIVFTPLWVPIRSYSGDGDKPLAAKICEMYNDKKHSMGTWKLNMGPYESHLMICNPIKLLENVSTRIIIKSSQLINENLYDKFKKAMIPFITDKIGVKFIDESDQIIIIVDKSNYKKYNDLMKKDFPGLKELLIIELDKPDTELQKKINDKINEKGDDLYSDVFIYKLKELFNNPHPFYLIKGDKCKNKFGGLLENHREIFRVLYLNFSEEKLEEYFKNIKEQVMDFLTKDCELTINKMKVEQKTSEYDEYIRKKIREYIKIITESLSEMSKVDKTKIPEADELLVGGKYKQKYLKYKKKYITLKSLQ
jgi:hypothetical protein